MSEFGAKNVNNTTEYSNASSAEAEKNAIGGRRALSASELARRRIEKRREKEALASLERQREKELNAAEEKQYVESRNKEADALIELLKKTDKTVEEKVNETLHNASANDFEKQFDGENVVKEDVSFNSDFQNESVTEPPVLIYGEAVTYGADEYFESAYIPEPILFDAQELPDCNYASGAESIGAYSVDSAPDFNYVPSESAFDITEHKLFEGGEPSDSADIFFSDSVREHTVRVFPYVAPEIYTEPSQEAAEVHNVFREYNDANHLYSDSYVERAAVNSHTSFLQEEKAPPYDVNRDVSEIEYGVHENTLEYCAEDFDAGYRERANEINLKTDADESLDINLDLCERLDVSSGEDYSRLVEKYDDYAERISHEKWADYGIETQHSLGEQFEDIHGEPYSVNFEYDLAQRPLSVKEDEKRYFENEAKRDGEFDSKLIYNYEKAQGMSLPYSSVGDIGENPHFENAGEPYAEYDESLIYGREEPLRQENFSDYDEKELLAFLRSSEKQVRLYKKELSKIERAQSGLSSEDSLKLIVDKINVSKHVVDERAAALFAISASSGKRYIKYHKKLLLESVLDYNRAIAEYEAETGYSLTPASRSLPNDIVSGIPYSPLPLIRYVEEGEPKEINASSGLGITRGERRELHREQMRIAKEGAREEKRLRKLFGGKSWEKIAAVGINLDDVKLKIERDLLALDSYVDSRITQCETERDFCEYSFSVSYSEKARKIKELKKEIKRLSRSRKRILKYARLDSERYYTALALSSLGATLKSRAKRDKFESLEMRLDLLLNERERVNEQLIKLYTGDLSGKGKKKINAKTVKIQRAAAKKVRRRFKSEMRILEKKIPLDIKEKLVLRVNKIIDSESKAAVLRYKLKKQRVSPEIKREIKREIKDCRASVKRCLVDLRYLMKKAKKYEERITDRKVQVAWIIGVVIALLLCAGAYLIFKTQIHAWLGIV